MRLAPKCSRNVNFAGRDGRVGAQGLLLGTNRTPSLSLCFLICKTGMRLLAWNSLHDSTNAWTCLQSDSSLLAAGDSAPNKCLTLSLRSLTSSPGVLPPGSADLEAIHSGFRGPQVPQTCEKVCFSGQGVWDFHQIHIHRQALISRGSEAERGAGWNHGGLGVLGEPGLVGLPASEGWAPHHRHLPGHGAGARPAEWARLTPWPPLGPQGTPVQVRGRPARGRMQVSAGCWRPAPRCGLTSHSTERAWGENTFPNK